MGPNNNIFAYLFIYLFIYLSTYFLIFFNTEEATLCFTVIWNLAVAYPASRTSLLSPHECSCGGVPILLPSPLQLVLLISAALHLIAWNSSPGYTSPPGKKKKKIPSNLMDPWGIINAIYSKIYETHLKIGPTYTCPLLDGSFIACVSLFLFWRPKKRITSTKPSKFAVLKQFSCIDGGHEWRKLSSLCRSVLIDCWESRVLLNRSRTYHDHLLILTPIDTIACFTGVDTKLRNAILIPFVHSRRLLLT